MAGILDALVGIVGGSRIKRDESLSHHTTQKVDAQAEFYIETERQDELIKVVKAAHNHKIPVFILGSGSRIIASDSKIEGVILKNNCRRFDKMGMKGKIRESKLGVEEMLVYAESGALMNQVVRFTIEEELEGLEYQLGLPGTVGGAIATNAKYLPTYLPVRKAVHSIRMLDESGEVQSYTGELPFFLEFDETWQQTKEVILSVVFKLVPGDKKALWERGTEAAAFRAKEAENRLGREIK